MTSDADFPRGIMDADTILEEQTAIVRMNAFYTDFQCQHLEGGGRDYFCVPGCGDFESFFYVFCEKPGDGSHALYDENGVFSNAVCDGSDAGV